MAEKQKRRNNEREENTAKGREVRREEEPFEKEGMVSNVYLFGVWIRQLATLCSQR